MSKILGVTDHRDYLDAAAVGSPWTELHAVPAPPGTSLGNLGGQDVFAQIGQALQLQLVGVYTPWASRRSTIEWEPIDNPDTNIMAWRLTDAGIQAAMNLAFGQPLPFVAILTASPLDDGTMHSMWDGTAYRYYETQVVYRQDDAGEPPKPFFLHWGERVDIAELPPQVAQVEPRAARVSGLLVFAAQVPREGTTTRAAPTSRYEDLLVPSAPPPPPPPPPSLVQQPRPAPPLSPGPAPAPPPAAAADAAPKMNLALPLAVTLGAAAVGYYVWSSKRAERR